MAPSLPPVSTRCDVYPLPDVIGSERGFRLSRGKFWSVVMQPPQAFFKFAHLIRKVTFNCELVYSVMDIHVLFPALADKFEVIPFELNIARLSGSTKRRWKLQVSLMRSIKEENHWSLASPNLPITLRSSSLNWLGRFWLYCLNSGILFEDHLEG